MNKAIHENNNPAEGLEKFECANCGCYFWVADRNNFVCPNCNGGTTMNDLFFKVISRDNPMFKDRSWTILNLSGTKDEDIQIPMPDNLIPCDICGEKIETPTVNLLRQEVGGDEIGLGAVCDECKEKYHSDIHVKIKLRRLPKGHPSEKGQPK